MKPALIVLPVMLLAGCATNKDYLAMLAAHQQVALQNAEATKARYNAMAQIANGGDPSSRTAAVMAMAMAPMPQTNLPPPPEDPVFKWASILLPAVTNVSTGYFGYRLGITQSNNAAQTTIAGYNTFGSMANAGYNALQGTATAGFNSNATLGSFIQAPQPNITLSGQGVIGSGSYSYNAPVTTTTTTNTTSNSNNTARNCSGGNGGGTTTGAAGGAASC